MHAVLIEVDVAGVDRDAGLTALRQQVVPAITQLPGFQSGTWLPGNDEGKGLSLTLWDTEEHARVMARPVWDRLEPGSERDGLALRGSRSLCDRISGSEPATSALRAFTATVTEHAATRKRIADAVATASRRTPAGAS